MHFAQVYMLIVSVVFCVYCFFALRMLRQRKDKLVMYLWTPLMLLFLAAAQAISEALPE